MHKKIWTHNLCISPCSRATQTENPTQPSAACAPLQAEETLSPGLPAPARARDPSPPTARDHHPALPASEFPSPGVRQAVENETSTRPLPLREVLPLSVVLKIKCKAAWCGGHNEGGKQTLLRVNLVGAQRLREGIGVTLKPCAALFLNKHRFHWWRRKGGLESRTENGAGWFPQVACGRIPASSAPITVSAALEGKHPPRCDLPSMGFPSWEMPPPGRLALGGPGV